MARRTRRRRESARSRPLLHPSAAAAVTPTATPVRTREPVEPLHWPSVLALLGIFLLALTLRTAWTLEPATADGFQLTGGSDPYYHKWVVDHVSATGEHLVHDEMLNYPYGANNNRPPLFDWSIAIAGLALAPFFGDVEESTWWAMEVLPAVYGALIVFPIYAIGRAQFGRQAGLLAALFIAVNSGHISHSTLSLADHDSYIAFFGTCAFFFFMRALTEGGDARWIADWRSVESIRSGFTNFLHSERLALGYAGLTGMTLALIALSWKGFPYLMVIIATYLVLQMVVNQFRRVDSLTTAMLGIVALSLPLLISFPYYHHMGFIETWWDAPAYVLLAFISASALLVPTRDLPWLLVLGGTATVATVGYLLLTYVFTELGFLLFSGQGYFVRTKLFDTIAEAQPPTFANFVFSFGPVSVWFGFFGLAWMAWQLSGGRTWKKDYLFILTWSAVALYMAQSAIRFIFNATPVMALLSGWVTWQLIERADFGAVLQAWRHYWGRYGPTIFFLAFGSLLTGVLAIFVVGLLEGFLIGILLLALVLLLGIMAAGEDQYRLRDRLSGLRRAFEIKRPAIAFVVVGLLLLPNSFQGYDAGIPYESKKDHDTAVYDFLRYSLLRPDEYQYGERTNATLYPDGVVGMYNRTDSSELWYLGLSGPSFPSDYWIEGLEWLAEQDTHLPPQQRPGFISWWDYGFWAIDIGEHPTVADNFQYGYQMAGNFIAAQSEQEAMALLLYRLIEPEVDRKGDQRFSPPVREVLLQHYSEDQVAQLEHIIANASDYIPDDDPELNRRNAAIRAGRPILMSQPTDVLADAIYGIEQVTGHSIRYFAADTRLMPYSADNTGILYAPVTLADYEIGDFVEVQAVLSNGETLDFTNATEMLKQDPTLTVTAQELTYKERFLNSMFYRAFIGWSGPDLGRPIEDGIPGISGALGSDRNLPPLPAWNLTHFRLVEFNSGLRILKYYDGAEISGVVRTPDGAPVPYANLTLVDELRTPHATTTTDKYGHYSLLATAGNHSLAVSLGGWESDQEKLYLTSNNLLTIRESLLISEAQATRQTDWQIELDLEVEPASVSGRLFWDKTDGEQPLVGVSVTARQESTDREFSALSDGDGNYVLEGLAPSGYTVTADYRGHTLELASYEGVAALRAGQAVTADGGFAPALVSGRLDFSPELTARPVALILHDHTNGTLMEQTTSGMFDFGELLPGSYTLQLLADDLHSDELGNNTLPLELEAGDFVSQNLSLVGGFRLEGVLTSGGQPIFDEQISIKEVSGQRTTEVFSTASGYFTTVLPHGLYDLYTLQEHGDAVTVYLDRIDSDSYSGPLDARLVAGSRVSGTLFVDLNGNGLHDHDLDEKIAGGISVHFDSPYGKIEVPTSSSGDYEAILPQGDFTAHALKMDEKGAMAVLRVIQVEYGSTTADLPLLPAQDLMVRLYEQHLGQDLPADGLLQLEGDGGSLSTWVTEAGAALILPSGSYRPTLEKNGYHLIDGERFQHYAIQEVVLEIERDPVEVNGQLLYSGAPVGEFQISFIPLSQPEYYYLNFSTDAYGNFAVQLPPDHYLYRFSREVDGVRYLAEGLLELELASPPVALGVVEAELALHVAGHAIGGAVLQGGQLHFTDTEDSERVIMLEATRFDGFNGWVPPGEWWVQFNDFSDSNHWSWLSTLQLEAPVELELELTQDHYLHGALLSGPTGQVVEEPVTLRLSSPGGTLFIDVEGGDFDPRDLPPGGYLLEAEPEGFLPYSQAVEIDGATFTTIELVPEPVPLTLNLSYRNASGSKLPLAAGINLTLSREGYSQTWTTDENGSLTLPELIPARYDLLVDAQPGGGGDRFSLDRSLNLRAGQGHQYFDYIASWEVQVQGRVFYDRNFDGKTDGNELLPDALIEFRDMAGATVIASLQTGTNGDFTTWLVPGNYLLWTRSSADASYVLLETLELEGSLERELSLQRGVHYAPTFLRDDDGSLLPDQTVEVSGGPTPLELQTSDGTLELLLPAGEYHLEAEWIELESSPDWIYVLDRDETLTLERDGEVSTVGLERQLLRGVDIILDQQMATGTLGQSIDFMFNLTGSGYRTTTFSASVSDAPANWTANFGSGGQVTVAQGETVQAILTVIPDDGVVPGAFTWWQVSFSWGGSGEQDPLTYNYELQVMPQQRPAPDFTISEVTWSPFESIVTGSEVTLRATVQNTIHNSGTHFPQVTFYAGDEIIEMTSAEFDGESEWLVETTWTADEGNTVIRVVIDPESLFEEQDETNNEQLLTLAVYTPVEESEGTPWILGAAVVLLLLIAYFAFRLRR